MINENVNYLKKLENIVSEVVGHNNFELKADMQATDVEGWDSLSHVQIIHRCEQKIDKRFTLEEISNLKSVLDLVNVIEKYT